MTVINTTEGNDMDDDEGDDDCNGDDGANRKRGGTEYSSENNKPDNRRNMCKEGH